jgi:predicted house-cleaning noncanonical NTP pyrophosphatase (MazG superfamily)
MKKEYNKLIRSKIEDIIFENDKSPSVEYFHYTDERSKELLRSKLNEEFNELIEASISEDIVEEAADLIEIIETYVKHIGYSKEELYAIKEGKYAKRGGFLKDDLYLMRLNHVLEKDI